MDLINDETLLFQQNSLMTAQEETFDQLIYNTLTLEDQDQQDLPLHSYDRMNSCEMEFGPEAMNDIFVNNSEATVGNDISISIFESPESSISSHISMPLSSNDSSFNINDDSSITTDTRSRTENYSSNLSEERIYHNLETAEGMKNKNVSPLLPPPKARIFQFTY